MTIDKDQKDDNEALDITDYHKYSVEVRGTTSILWNRLMVDLSKIKLSSKTKESDADRELRIWRDKLHTTAGDLVYWPSENVQEAMIGGAKYWGFKISMKALHNLIARGLICESMSIFDANGEPITQDSEAIIKFEKLVRRADGKTVFTIRPMLAAGWTGKTTIHAWDARLTRDIIFNTARFAGQFNGLGDWRKYYGRFEVTAFDEITKQTSGQKEHLGTLQTSSLSEMRG